MFDILPSLLDLGFAATPIFAPGVREFLTGDEDDFLSRREPEGVRFRFTDATAIKRLIRGRLAVLLVGNPATPLKNHAMAWKDGKLFDVDPRRDPHWRHINDADLPILGAVIVTLLGPHTALM